MRTYRSYAYLILCVLIALSAGRVLAQDNDPEVVVMHSGVDVGQDGLDLRIFFTVRDGNHHPVPTNKIESAKLIIREDKPPAFASLEDPATPIKVFLVLDASGSMAKVAETLRQAASDAIDKAPDQAQFAVYAFSDVSGQDAFAPGLDFSSDRAAVKDYIRSQYTPQAFAPTCLFTATYKALEYLAATAQPGERRAIIVFTDGNDERRDGSTCSDRTLQDVIRLAAPAGDNATALYTIGLCLDRDCSNLGPGGLATLDQMATKTNGVTVSGEISALSGSFFNIMDDIKSQKLARLKVFPCEERQGTLLVSVIGVGEELRGVVELPEHPCYAPSASGQIANFTAKGNDFAFDVGIKNLSTAGIAEIEMNVLSPSNTRVYSLTTALPIDPDAERHFAGIIPATALDQKGLYRLQVFARTGAGMYFQAAGRENEGTDVLAEYEFNYTAELAVSIAINAKPTVDYQRDVFVVNDIRVDDPLNLLQTSRLKQYKVLIKDGDKVLFDRENFHVNPKDGSLTIPLDDLRQEFPLPAGGPMPLQVVVELLAENNLGAVSAPYEFEFPPQKSFIARYWPLIGIVGLLLGLMFAGIAAFRQKRAARPQGFAPLVEGITMMIGNETPATPQTAPGGMVKLKVAMPGKQAKTLTITEFPYTLGRDQIDSSNDDFSRNYLRLHRAGGGQYSISVIGKNGILMENKYIGPNEHHRISVNKRTVIELRPRGRIEFVALS
jgi:hypothetical protein